MVEINFVLLRNQYFEMSTQQLKRKVINFSYYLGYKKTHFFVNQQVLYFIRVFICPP